MNYDEADRFLRLLAPSGVISYQTFDDGPDVRPGLARKLHGPLAAHSDELRRRNDKGAGVFVMVNRGNGRGRTAKDVQEVRAVFVDLDSAPLEPVLKGPLPPSVTVESSPGRFHAYWLAQGVPLAAFKPIQLSLAARFHGDRTVNDLCRVMRIPGFNHLKAQPFESRILSADGYRYTLDALTHAFGPFAAIAPAKPRAGACSEVIAEGKRNAELFRIARSLVNKGLSPEAVNRRLQKTNAERCQPPLCATEVDAIVSAASSQPSKGSLAVPLALLDSAEFRKLKFGPVSLLMDAMRRQSGNPEALVCLPFEDFKGRVGNKAFYRYRDALLAHGWLERAGKSGDADQFRLRVSK
jgi:hypothetical protein